MSASVQTNQKSMESSITEEKQSAWAPFKNNVFRMLWIATLASNIGTWMHEIGAGWLMTSLSPSPVMVALVQTATTLPAFFLALPAGALADIIDRRRYLIAVQIWLSIIAGILGITVITGLITPVLLVVLTFAMGIGAAMMMPAWAAVTPEVVPKHELASAIALNSMGINIARAIGPALAGIIVSFAGTGAVFILNAISFIGVIMVLFLWKREVQENTLPVERFFGAMRNGIRFAKHAPALQAATIRGVAFFIFASASWALLPLVAKSLEGGGPHTFGMLVASIGVGAVIGAFLLPTLREKLTRDILVSLATVVYALSMFVIATVDQFIFLCIAMALSGIAWIAILSSLQVAAQMALPSWVRSRGLALFMAIFMGSMALGSLLWGKIAELYTIDHSLIVASIGAITGIILTWRWKISGIEDIDLSPSMHWPEPQVHENVTHDRGPVLITIKYEVLEEDIPEFLHNIRQLGRNRKRDGAYSWSVFENTKQPNQFIETFYTNSWLEHLRQHEHVTKEDRHLQEKISKFLKPGTSPSVEHYVAPN